MKPRNLKLLAFPFMILFSGVVCGLVLWKFGTPSKSIQPKLNVVAVKPAMHPEPIVAPKVEIEPPKIVVQEPPKVLKKTIKRVTHKKHTKKLRAGWNRTDLYRVAQVSSIVVEDISDKYFDTESDAATDTAGPIEVLASLELNQTYPTETYHPNVKMSEVVLDETVISGGYAKEQRLGVVEGLIAQNEFGGEKEALQNLKNEKLEEIKSPEAKTEAKEPATQVTAEIKKPELSNQTALEEIKPDLVKEPQEVLAENRAIESIPERRIEPEQESTSEPSTEATTKEEPKLVVETPVSSKISIPVTAPSIQKPSSQIRVAVNTHPQPAPVSPDKTTQNNKEQNDNGTKKKERGAFKGTESTDENQDVDDAGVFHGKIYVDTQLRKWLSDNKAHFELYLHRESSKNPQDTVFIDYEFGDDEFEFEGKDLKGTYELVAGFFTGKDATPIAQLKYPYKIASGDYKKRIVFDLNKKDFDKQATTEPVRQSFANNVLNITIFKGATGNYRQTTPVAGAFVQVIGFKEWGSFTSDAEGNVRIPKLAGRGEYLLDVSANGFYPTRQIVPVFDGVTYSAVYIIAKDDVYSITHYFSKHDQQSGKSIVMGRVFNTKTRAPQRDEEISLSFRKGRPVYFDSLPNMDLRATSDSGLFGFFNVEPSIRSIQRESQGHSSLINLLPDYAIYQELGRGGLRSLKGRIFDPFKNEGVSSKLHIVGDENNEEISNDEGFFKSANIDLPPGIVTIEVKTEGYPITWHSIPWNVREPERVKNLFMLDKEVLEESKKINRVVSQKGTGNIVGGAEDGFFTKERQCVQVRLEDQFGKRLAHEKGPYPIAGAKAPAKGFCLTKTAPGFAFYNVPSGEYILKWVDKAGFPFKSRVLRVGMDRLSVVVN